MAKEKLRVVILGSAGQVGSELLSAEVAIEASMSEADFIGFARNELDITHRDGVKLALAEIAPDWVVNAAAYTAVDKAESDSEGAYAVNAIGPGVLAEICDELGSRLIHISTDYVYSGDGDAVLQEVDAVGPTGVYGASKLAGEYLVGANCKEHLILRTAWVFGAAGNNFVKTMLRLGAERSELSIVADQWGGPTSARAIAVVILTIIKRFQALEAEGQSLEQFWGIYNFSGMPHVTWAEFAKSIFETATSMGLLASKPDIREIRTEDYPTLAKRPKNSRLSNTKINETFDIDPDDWRASLADVLREVGSVRASTQ